MTTASLILKPTLDVYLKLTPPTQVSIVIKETLAIPPPLTCSASTQTKS